MHCWARYLSWLVIAVLGMGNLLSACGQKGPLYLPPDPARQEETHDLSSARP
jgi:predicted small lipoprotein YifL